MHGLVIMMWYRDSHSWTRVLCVDKLVIPDRWGDRVVHAEVLCRACGYMLRGLRGRGKCPECGLDVWGSLLRSVDPLAQGLPRLSNPKKVGNGLVVLTASMFLSALLVVFLVVGGDVPVGWNWIREIHRLVFLGGGGIVGVILQVGLLLLALGAAWSLWPKSKSGIRAVKRDVLLLMGGLGEWGASVVIFQGWGVRLGVDGDLGFELMELLGVVGAGMILLGLRGVLGVIGQRSFAYRSSQSGRQSVGTMLAALVAGLVGELIIEIVRFLPVTTLTHQVASRMNAVGAVVIWVCIVMLLIGLAYLVMNAWWVRQAIRRPFRTLDDVLHVPSRDETILGEDETRFEVTVKKEVVDRSPPKPGE